MTMSLVTRVLIHPQGNSEGSLREAIESIRPTMVFLISNNSAKRARLVLKYLAERNQDRLGKLVEDVEHCELIEIGDAFSDSTVLEMVEAVTDAKEKATKLAGKCKVEIHVGLAGGTKLMVIGAAIAAIEKDVQSTYYVNEEQMDRPGGVIEISFINNLTKSLSWLRGHYRARKNLAYLKEAIRREDSGGTISSVAIAEAMGVDPRSVRNAMKQLKVHGLVEYAPGAKPQVYSSTVLGRFVLGMIGAPEGDE